VDAIGQALHKRGYSGQVPDQQDQALELLEAQAQVDAYQAYVRRALMANPELTAQQLLRDLDFQQQIKQRFGDISALQYTHNTALTRGQKALQQVYRPGDEQAWERQLRSDQAQQRAQMDASGETQRQADQRAFAQQEERLRREKTQEAFDDRVLGGQGILGALRSMDGEALQQGRTAPIPPVAQLPNEPLWQFEQRVEAERRSAAKQQTHANIAAGLDPEQYLTQQERQTIDQARQRQLDQQLTEQTTEYFYQVLEQTGSVSAAMDALDELATPSMTPLQALQDENSTEPEWKRLETYQRVTDAEIAWANTRAHGQGDLSAGMAMDIAGYGAEDYDADKAYFLSRFGANGHDFGESSAYLTEKGQDYPDYLYEGRTLEENLLHYLGEGGPLDGSEYDRLPEGVKRQVSLARTYVSGLENDYGVNIPRYTQSVNHGRDWKQEVENARNLAAFELGLERFGLDTGQMIIYTLEYGNLPTVALKTAVNLGWLDGARPGERKDKPFFIDEITLNMESDKARLLELTPGGEDHQRVTQTVTDVAVFMRDAIVTLLSAGLANGAPVLGKILPTAFNIQQNFGRAHTETIYNGGTEQEALANGAVNAVVGIVLDYGLEKVGDAVSDLVKAAKLDRTLVQSGSKALKQVTGAPVSTSDFFNAIVQTWISNRAMDVVPEVRWTQEK
ncbi:MAG: hypothetical protein ACOYJA_13300, partial [Christensenellales bacterium]